MFTNDKSQPKQKLMFILLALTLFLTACGSDNDWEPSVSKVEDIKFEKYQGNNKRVRIETEKEVLLIHAGFIEFYTTTNDEVITLTQIAESDREWKSIDEVFFGSQKTHELLIPEDQLKPLSSEYADLFGETLEHTPQEKNTNK